MSLCLRPLESPHQRLLDFAVVTTPPTGSTAESDPFGNLRHVLTINRHHDRLEVVSTSLVEVDQPEALPECLPPDAWKLVRSMGNNPLWWDFTRPGPLARPSPTLDEFIDRIGVHPGTDPLSGVLALSSVLHHTFDYTPGATSVDSPIEDILTTGRGVCQDYTHVFIAIARSWGIPTRYVSGYLFAVDGKNGDTGVFGAATHAWAEICLPDLGWIGIDPTNNAVAGRRYVRIAVGRDYRDVPPTRGVIEGGGKSRLEVDVRMTLV